MGRTALGKFFLSKYKDESSCPRIRCFGRDIHQGYKWVWKLRFDYPRYGLFLPIFYVISNLSNLTLQSERLY
jgi:hypothetical protein